jgi:hypothetical protein
LRPGDALAFEALTPAEAIAAGRFHAARRTEYLDRMRAQA